MTVWQNNRIIAVKFLVNESLNNDLQLTLKGMTKVNFGVRVVCVVKNCLIFPEIQNNAFRQGNQKI
jgi:hypothetical protein